VANFLRDVEAADAMQRRSANRLGLLTEVDAMCFAAYCQAFSRWAQAERLLTEMAERDPETGGLVVKTLAGASMANVLLSVARNAARDMMKFGEPYGVTPLTRTRVASSISGAPSSKFDGLLA
jgi:phage terminase small subunit